MRSIKICKYDFTLGFFLAWLPVIIWFGYSIWMLTLVTHPSSYIIISFTLGAATVGIIWKIYSLKKEMKEQEKLR